MSVKYKIYKNNNSTMSSCYGKYYARAVHDETWDTDDLADMIEKNVSVKRSDVLGVISELVETMTVALQAGHKVKLDRFGTFKIGISSSGADSAEDFDVSRNIKGTHVLFQPFTTVSHDGSRNRSFLSGVKVSEVSYYDNPESSSDSSADADDTGAAGTGELIEDEV